MHTCIFYHPESWYEIVLLLLLVLFATILNRSSVQVGMHILKYNRGFRVQWLSYCAWPWRTEQSQDSKYPGHHWGRGDGFGELLKGQGPKHSMWMYSLASRTCEWNIQLAFLPHHCLAHWIEVALMDFHFNYNFNLVLTEISLSLPEGFHNINITSTMVRTSTPYPWTSVWSTAHASVLPFTSTAAIFSHHCVYQ